MAKKVKLPKNVLDMQADLAKSQNQSGGLKDQKENVVGHGRHRKVSTKKADKEYKSQAKLHKETK